MGLNHGSGTSPYRGLQALVGEVEAPAEISPGDAMLLERGTDVLLLEQGDKLLLEA